MNSTFKLGKVSIPVAEDVKIEIEGLEMSVTDYDMREGLNVLKALPGVLREMKAIIEGEDAPPSAGKVEEVNEEEVGMMNHPVFGKCKVVKMKTSLGEMLDNIGKLPTQGKNPLESFLDSLKEFEEGKAKGGLFDKLI